MKNRQQRRAEEWRPAFLATLRNTGNVRVSCETAGISRKTAYKAKDSSEDFRAKWNEAMDDAIDSLEAVAQVRARSTSDLLLIFLLKAHRPDKYRETVRQEHTGRDGTPIEVTLDAKGALAARIAAIVERTAADGGAKQP